ncbi:hypothetical protein GC167_01070 [bacterium]|nr:hypothetical protein [bacterium]
MRLPSFLSGFSTVFSPKGCPGCGSPYSETLDGPCPWCRLHFPSALTPVQQQRLEALLGQRFPLESALALAKFCLGGRVQKMLHEIKYLGGYRLAWGLGRALGRGCEALGLAPGCLVPVPLHPNKLKKRGYNQSEWIARGMESVLSWSVDTELLHRVHEAGSQTRLTVQERQRNALQQFSCTRDADPCVHWILVDDMITTGATLESCARALREAGAVRISAVSLACEIDL